MFDDRTFLKTGDWQRCCLKKRPTAESEKVGVMGYSAFGVITSPEPPIIVYLRSDTDPGRDFERTKIYESIDALLADGWIVD